MIKGLENTNRHWRSFSAWQYKEVYDHYLEEGGVALKSGGAEGSHRTQAGPEMDIGE